MAADWGARLVRLARGTLPSEKGVTHVTGRNRNCSYVSKPPVVTPVTPVTSFERSFPIVGEIGGVTAGVTLPDEVAERAAIMEADGGLPRQIAFALARLEPTMPGEMMDTLARFADEWGARSQALGWSIENLFGLPPARSLVTFLQPRSAVVALSARTATIRHASGDTFLFTRQGVGSGDVH
jgi:hypothetical protein